MQSHTRVGIAVLLAVVPGLSRASSLSEDPYQGVSPAYIINEFMQFVGTQHSPTQLHTGIDVAVPPSTSIFPPVPSSDTVKILATSVDNQPAIVAVAGAKQAGKWAALTVLHITLNSNLQVGHVIPNTTPFGESLSGSLSPAPHFDLMLSSDNQIKDDDLVNPRISGFENAPWITDTTDPVPDITTIHQDPNPPHDIVFEINAWDPITGQTNKFNGLYAAELFLDAGFTPVDKFKFDKYVSKTGTYPPDKAEFYYCVSAQCVPSGDNNPNVLRYKLTWRPTDTNNHIWTLKLYDAASNVHEGHPMIPLVNPVCELGGEIRHGRAFVTWRACGLGPIDHFDLRVSDTQGETGQYLNDVPISVIAGASEYSFDATIPSDWSEIWVRLVGVDAQGAERQLDELELTTLPTLRTLSVSPNPSTGALDFRIGMREGEDALVTILDTTGRTVRKLFQGIASDDQLTVLWDGTDDRGRPTPAGVYLVRVLTLGESREIMTRKFTVLR